MPTLDKIKNRIVSVKSTSKITKAMELVATAKLKKAYDFFKKTKISFQEVVTNFQNIFSSCTQLQGKYFNKQLGNNLWVVLSSNLGLCGGYNINNMKLLRTHFQKGDVIFAFGQKAASLCRFWNIPLHHNYHEVIAKPSFDQVEVITNDIWEFFSNNKNLTKLKLITNRFINNVTFEAQIIDLLPIIPLQKPSLVIQDFEQKPSIITKTMIPMFLAYAFYTYIREAKLVEEASRRLAMEAATKNANELLDELMIEYNQQRQANITQEISEIIGGASA